MAKKYTAKDFFDAVEKSARENANITVKTGVRVTSETNAHTDEVGAKVSNAVVKAAVRSTAEVNSHVDEVGDKLDKRIATATTEINNHTDEAIQTVGGRFDAIENSITAAARRIIVGVMSGVVPLWYGIMALVAATVSGFVAWFTKIKPLTLAEPVKQIIRDNAGNAVGTTNVELTTTTTLNPFMGKLVAIAVAAIVLALLLLIGATVYAAILRRRAAEDNE